jgi:TatA/E family protein of Tat protein translocase
MNTMLAVFGMGAGEIIFVMAAALILFGANKIPQFAKGLGQAMKEFKKASSDVTNEIHKSLD